MAGTRVRETEALGTVKPGPSGKFEVCIIEGDRWGSSGYYPADVIERDGPNVFSRGTHIFMDHPTESEMQDRPERSVRDLAGFISSTPTWNGDTKQLLAEATFFPWAETLMTAVAPHTGMSINCYAHQESGEVGGKSGQITKQLIEAVSVDVVTRPGAGGAILRAIESVRSTLAGSSREPSKESGSVTTDSKVGGLSDDTLSALTTAITNLTKLLADEATAREQEAARRQEAEKPDPLALVGALAEAKLPKAYQSRVIEAVKAGMKPEDAITAAKTELEAVLKEVAPSTLTPGKPIGAPQQDSGGVLTESAFTLPNGFAVDISDARVKRAIGEKPERTAS